MRFTKRFLTHTFGLALVKISGGVMRDPDGEIFYINPVLMGPLDALNLRRGLYESAERQALRSGIEPSSQVIELGANIGVVSRMIQRGYLKPDGELLCVEGNPFVLDALRRNLEVGQHNSVRHTFNILSVAIGAPEYDGQILPYYVYNNLSSGLGSRDVWYHKARVVKTPVSSLESIVKNKALREDATLVADIEGGEHSIIYHEARTLRRFSQMVIEMHEPDFTGKRETPKDMVNKIIEIGFDVTAQAGNTFAFKRRNAARSFARA